MRLFKQRLLQLSLGYFYQYEFTWKAEFVRQVFYRKFIVLAVNIYYQRKAVLGGGGNSDSKFLENSLKNEDL